MLCGDPAAAVADLLWCWATFQLWHCAALVFLKIISYGNKHVGLGLGMGTKGFKALLCQACCCMTPGTSLYPHASDSGSVKWRWDPHLLAVLEDRCKVLGHWYHFLCNGFLPLYVQELGPKCSLMPYCISVWSPHCLKNKCSVWGKYVEILFSGLNVSSLWKM